MSKQLSPGDVIESHCTKCRALMNHTIIALVNGQPERVECNTCKGVHKFRPPVAAKPAKVPRSTTPRRTPANRINTDLALWTESVGGESSTPKAYSMHAVYKVDDLIRHPSFGVGRVMQLLPPNKVEVLFQDGRKLLRCG